MMDSFNCAEQSAGLGQYGMFYVHGHVPHLGSGSARGLDSQPHPNRSARVVQLFGCLAHAHLRLRARSPGTKGQMECWNAGMQHQACVKLHPPKGHLRIFMFSTFAKPARQTKELESVACALKRMMVAGLLPMFSFVWCQGCGRTGNSGGAAVFLLAGVWGRFGGKGAIWGLSR